MERKKIEKYIEDITEINNLISDIENDDTDDINEVVKINDEINKLLKSLNYEIEETKESYLKIKIKKTHQDAVIPSYAKNGDAGMDLTVTEIKEETEHSILYGFGLSIEIPNGYVGLIFPRSSIKNFDLVLSNSVGVIDSGYRGEIMGSFKKTSNDPKIYKIGERAAQIFILPYPKIQFVTVNDLTKTERNEGGFGHTGK